MANQTSLPTRASDDCIVVGAGIAGVCAAIEIQRRGARVTLIDAAEPGSGASFGNAGIVVNTRLTPVFAGLTPATLFQMLRNPSSPLNLRWSSLPGLSPWFLRMLRHAGAAEVARITRALASLCQPGATLYPQLWAEAGMQDLVQARGNIALNLGAEDRDRDWEKTAFLRSLGVPMERMERRDISDRAPAVGPRYSHGIFSPDFCHTLDPQGFVARLAALFRARGGRLQPAKVQHLLVERGRIAGVMTDSGRFAADSVVVAAGTGSARLARQAREPMPHQAVGGYHLVLSDPGVPLDTPILPMDFRFAITPMAAGIRLAGIYEFGADNLAPNHALYRNMLRHAGDVLPGISVGKNTIWRGYRSYFPDGLPVIGPSTKHGGLYYLFGLSSAGMINAPAAARLLASLWANEPTDIDAAPFSAGRRF
jgi:D-amino-acid dehydrogenase